MTEWLPVLNVISLVLGVGVPVGTIVYQAGKRNQWEKGIEQFHSECKGARERNEGEIFERLLDVEEKINYQKGKANGARG